MKVRMIAASIGGRSEGIISSIKDNYGFIQLAERNADAYFRLSDMLLSELQRVVKMNTDHQQPNKTGASNLVVSAQPPPKLEVGSEILFDLSLQPPQRNNFSGRGGGSGHNNTARQQQNEKEQVHAQRLAFLSSSTVKLTRTVAEGIKATVVKK